MHAMEKHVAKLHQHAIPATPLPTSFIGIAVIIGIAVHWMPEATRTPPTIVTDVRAGGC